MYVSVKRIQKRATFWKNESEYYLDQTGNLTSDISFNKKSVGSGLAVSADEGRASKKAHCLLSCGAEKKYKVGETNAIVH